MNKFSKWLGRYLWITFHILMYWIVFFDICFCSKVTNDDHFKHSCYISFNISKIVFFLHSQSEIESGKETLCMGVIIYKLMVQFFFILRRINITLVYVFCAGRDIAIAEWWNQLFFEGQKRECSIVFCISINWHANLGGKDSDIQHDDFH